MYIHSMKCSGMLRTIVLPSMISLICQQKNFDCCLVQLRLANYYYRILNYSKLSASETDSYECYDQPLPEIRLRVRVVS